MPTKKRKHVNMVALAENLTTANKSTRRAAAGASAVDGRTASGEYAAADMRTSTSAVEQQPTNVHLEMMDDGCGDAAGSSIEGHFPRSFDVGRDESVVGVQDQVGIVGCVVVMKWSGVESRCFVDAYAPDAPDGPSYVISWVKIEQSIICSRAQTWPRWARAAVEA